MDCDAEVNEVAEVEHVELGLDGGVLEVPEGEEDGHEAVVEDGEERRMTKQKPFGEADDNDAESERNLRTKRNGFQMQIEFINSSMYSSEFVCSFVNLKRNEKTENLIIHFRGSSKKFD